MARTLIRNAMVFDGTGATPVSGSLLVDATAQVEIFGDHQSFAEAKGMDSGLGYNLGQHTDNLYAQQEGLEASAKGGLSLATYQEVRVRHFEQPIDTYMTLEALQVELEELQCSAA